MDSAGPSTRELTAIARRRAEALIEMRRHDLASRELAILLSMKPTDSWALASLATCRNALGDVEGARRLAAEAVAANPQNAYAHSIRAWVGGMTNEEVRRAVETAVGLAPTHVDFLYQLGHHYVQTGQWQAAGNTAMKCLQINPDHVGARRLLAEHAFKSSSHRDAVRLLKDALRIDPQDAAVHWQLSHYYSTRRQLRASLFHQAKVIELLPTASEQQDHYLKLFYSASPIYMLTMLAFNAGPLRLGRFHWLAAGVILLFPIIYVDGRIERHQPTHWLLAFGGAAALIASIQAVSRHTGDWISDQWMRTDPVARRIAAARRTSTE